MIKRASNGKFAPEHPLEGYEQTPEHIAKVKLAAQRRANLMYRKISVCGVVYPNVSQASKATAVSSRALQRYAESDCIIFQQVFFID